MIGIIGLPGFSYRENITYQIILLTEGDTYGSG